MNVVRHFAIQLRRLREWAKREVLAHRVQYHNPTLRCEYPVIWKYPYDGLDAIELGRDVYIMAQCEIIVFKETPRSSKMGRLAIGDGSVLTTGVNVRAAGGTIRIGRNSVIAEHSVVVAANHAVYGGSLYLRDSWDEERTDVVIGDNVWVGAGCYLLPGCAIGDNSVIGAGSVVTKSVPPNEIWAGVPARKIRDVPTREEFEARQLAARGST
jgi:acetyltransferase-like isoleucine patch superfamily enzyme